MAAKPQTVFTCSNCDAQFPKWVGQCEQCGKWGTVEEGVVGGDATLKAQRAQKQAGVKAAKPISFGDVRPEEAKRETTGIPEVDRVLGGGIVPGSLTLLGGDPGIGKSTLVAQLAGIVKGEVLYISGEESAAQIKMRLDRLGVDGSSVSFLGDESVEVICKTVTETKPALVIVDSIQTVAVAAVEAEAGSVNQIKASTVHFLETAKSSGVPIMLIGHVTKGGDIGGPKMLEHMVDTVLYLEGDRHHHFRLLRSVKNRFGSTNEIGVFDMQQSGLQAVENPSQVFLDERSAVSGSCMTAVIEGNRTFLVEVQALVTKTTFGYPQRKASGFDTNRLNMLLAVLTRRAQLPFDEYDVHVNIVGGMKFADPAMDVAVCMALVSSMHDAVLPTPLVAWGEVGLGGEVRSAGRAKERAEEAKRFGLTEVVSSKKYKTIVDAITALHLE